MFGAFFPARRPFFAKWMTMYFRRVHFSRVTIIVYGERLMWTSEQSGPWKLETSIIFVLCRGRIGRKGVEHYIYSLLSTSSRGIQDGETEPIRHGMSRVGVLVTCVTGGDDVNVFPHRFSLTIGNTWFGMYTRGNCIHRDGKGLDLPLSHHTTLHLSNSTLQHCAYRSILRFHASAFQLHTIDHLQRIRNPTTNELIWTISLTVFSPWTRDHLLFSPPARTHYM